MKRFWFGVLAACVMAGFALPAKADLDRHCLAQCVNGGSPGSACIAQCSYDMPLPAPMNSAESKNAIFNAPLPVDSGQIVVPPRPPDAPAVNTDYTCLNRCLQNGMQYKFCDESCAHSACLAGKILCSDGMIPGAQLQSPSVQAMVPGAVNAVPAPASR